MKRRGTKRAPIGEAPVRQWISSDQYVDWPSVGEAARRTEIFKTLIFAAKSGKQKTAGGFRWESIGQVDPKHLYGNCDVSPEEIKGRPGGHPVRQWLSDEWYVDWRGMSEAERHVGLPSGSVSGAARGRYATAGGFRWETIREVDPERLYGKCGVSAAEIRTNFRRYPVRQWLSDDQYVDWLSVADAAHEVGIFRTAICAAKSGKLKSAGGFRWEAIREVDPERLYGKCGVSAAEIRTNFRRYPVRQWLSDTQYVDWHTIAEAARKTGVSQGGISLVSRCKSGFAGGFRWERILVVDPERLYEELGIECENIKARAGRRPVDYKNLYKESPEVREMIMVGRLTQPKKPVRQWLSDAQYVDWTSVTEAVLATGVAPAGIASACQGRRKAAGGFRWEAIPQVDPQRLYECCGLSRAAIKARRRHCPIRQWLSDTQYVDWTSMVEAAAASGVFQNHISLVCSGKQKTAGGFRWEKISQVDPARLYGNCGIARQEITARALKKR